MGSRISAMIEGPFMKRRKNRPVERNAVNAVRTLFEGSGYVFQEVDQANDYGKDAYVDLVNGESVTGIMLALQIKGGKKYKRTRGYVIPIDGHAEIWRESTTPVAGIVHDPDSGELHWCDISTFLLEHWTNLPQDIPVDATNKLDAATLETSFKPHFRSMANERAAALAVLRICSEKKAVRIGALLDCFAFGRSDPRMFIMVRQSIGMLSGSPLRLAITILAHATMHPDIMWGKSNWIPELVCSRLKSHWHWSAAEITRMLRGVGWQYWQRGDVGQDLYMLLYQDPQIRMKIERIAVSAVRRLDERVAWAALYMAVYWAGDKGQAKYEEMLMIEPTLRQLPLSGELEMCLSDQGWLSMFE